MSDGKSKGMPKELLCLKIDPMVKKGFKDYCYSKYKVLWGMNREGERALREYLDRVSPGWEKKKN